MQSSPQRYRTSSPHSRVPELRFPDSLRKKFTWGSFRFPTKYYLKFHGIIWTGRGRNRSKTEKYWTIPTHRPLPVQLNSLDEIVGFKHHGNVIRRIYSFPDLDMMAINIHDIDQIRKLTNDEKAYLEIFPRGNPPLW